MYTYTSYTFSIYIRRDYYSNASFWHDLRLYQFHLIYPYFSINGQYIVSDECTAHSPLLRNRTWMRWIIHQFNSWSKWSISVFAVACFVVLVFYFHIEYEIDKSAEINKSSECYRDGPQQANAMYYNRTQLMS